MSVLEGVVEPAVVPAPCLVAVLIVVGHTVGSLTDAVAAAAVVAVGAFAVVAEYAVLVAELTVADAVAAIQSLPVAVK